MTRRQAQYLFFALLLATGLRAELRLPAIFGDHMVLQCDRVDSIWGWDAPGTSVSVLFADTTAVGVAGVDGRWVVRLAPLHASAASRTLTITGTSTRVLRDVLVGEVWVCAGQSNMGFMLQGDVNGDLEAAASNLPALRLIKVPQLGTQQLQDDFKGAWAVATPATAGNFSNVGLRFGRYLQQILGVPVGLVHDAWGGSSAEAWIRREVLESDPRLIGLRDRTHAAEARLQSEAGRMESTRAMAAWRAAEQAARTAGHGVPPAPEDWLRGPRRAGNVFAGMLHPILGFGIRGVIWYQGEANASRADEYATLFPLLIEQWRREWGQGDLPFYWVQLPRFFPAQAAPDEPAPWAELRDAQTQTLQLAVTGQAVTIDLGEGRNIHPRDKYLVAARLARWALARTYGVSLPYRSPQYRSLQVSGGRARVAFDCFGGSLAAFDGPEVRGFVIAGADGHWHWANARLAGRDQVEVWSDDVPVPIALRYGWANNPRCNLISNAGLPATPFRTDRPDGAAPPVDTSAK